jgi:hypothetical protein
VTDSTACALDGVPRVVRPGAGDDRALRAHLVHDQRHERDLLLVGERCRLARRAGHDEAVRAVGEEMMRQCDGRLLVDATVGVKRRDHGREQAFVGAHGDSLARRPAQRARVRQGDVARVQPASGSPLVSFGGA